MEIRRLCLDEVGRLVDECWFPYAEELAEDDDRMRPVPAHRDEQVAFYRGKAASDDVRFLVAVADGDGADGSDAASDGESGGDGLPGSDGTPARDEGERFAGFAVASIRSAPVFERGTSCSVDDVYVAPAYRRQGVASELLEALVAWGRERGADYARLSVDVDNETAQACYREHGFEVWRHEMARDL